MASPLVDFCEQADPAMSSEIRRLGGVVGSARRIQASFLAGLEKKTLVWLAERTPAHINSDHLTAIGFVGQLMAGAFYALSRWNEYSRVRQERSLSEIANQVKDRDMPLWSYTLMHREARLSDSEVAALFRWTQTERSRLIEESLQLQESSKPR